MTPCRGDCYYYVDGCGNVKQALWEDTDVDRCRLQNGNVMRPGLNLEWFIHLIRHATSEGQANAILECADACNADAPFMTVADHTVLAREYAKRIRAILP